jgi:hypothetical protein
VDADTNIRRIPATCQPVADERDWLRASGIRHLDLALDEDGFLVSRAEVQRKSA